MVAEETGGGGPSGHRHHLGRRNQDIEFLVFYIVGTFWNTPLHMTERRFLTGKIGQKFLVSTRIAHGVARGTSLEGPCDVSYYAVLPRHVSGPVSEDRDIPRRPGSRFVRRQRRSTPTAVRLHDRAIALTWMVLGFSRAQISTPVKWIGASLSREWDRIVVSVTQPTLDELQDVRGDSEPCRHASTGGDRSWAKCRRYVPYHRGVGGAPQVLVGEVDRACAALLRHLSRPPERRTEACIRSARSGASGTGSSSQWTRRYGASGAVVVNGWIREWIADARTKHDEELPGHPLGSVEGQKTWESLAVLAAMRAWTGEWRRTCVFLELRADSIAAITRTLHMNTLGRVPGMVARELALRLGKRHSGCAAVPALSAGQDMSRAGAQGT